MFADHKYVVQMELFHKNGTVFVVRFPANDTHITCIKRASCWAYRQEDAEEFVRDATDSPLLSFITASIFEWVRRAYSRTRARACGHAARTLKQLLVEGRPIGIQGTDFAFREATLSERRTLAKVLNSEPHIWLFLYNTKLQNYDFDVRDGPRELRDVLQTPPLEA